MIENSRNDNEISEKSYTKNARLSLENKYITIENCSQCTAFNGVRFTCNQSPQKVYDWVYYI